MKYIYIDGDNIGLEIETSFLDNDELGLAVINHKVSELVENISSYLLNKKQVIIFSGADGIICKGLNIDLLDLIEYIRTLSQKITFSIGAGNSLRDAYIALRYAKSVGKNIAVFLREGNFEIKDSI